MFCEHLESEAISERLWNHDKIKRPMWLYQDQVIPDLFHFLFWYVNATESYMEMILGLEGYVRGVQILSTVLEKLQIWSYSRYVYFSVLAS